MQYALIMAGGSGTRLWPLSRSDKPKQLLPMVRGRSLLQLAWERLEGLLPPDRIFVCAGAAHAEQVFANLPALPRANFLGEPAARDTANAVGFAAAVVHRRDPDAVMGVFTADHVITPVDRFQASVREAFAVVADQPGALLTFGIVPTHGHTGLGYIHRGEAMGRARGAYRVLGFKEKPDKPTADHYVESERYYWNSGMFVWRCDVLLRELQLHLPENFAGLMRVAEAWNTPQQSQVLSEVYPKLKKISIDYAVMEPASLGKEEVRVLTVEMPVQWLDVGSWPAMADILENDDRDNATTCPVCLLVDSDNNIIVCDDPEHLVATIGLSDTILVHTRDVTLACPRQEAERVKDLVARAREKFGQKYQ